MAPRNGTSRWIVLALARTGALLLPGVAAASCGSDYPLAPTPCDDWCRATLRADCENDFPDECVASCLVNDAPVLLPICASEWDALQACYERGQAEDFFCEPSGHSRPFPNMCGEARTNFAICESEARSIASCVQFCEMAADAVIGLEGDACRTLCEGDIPGCSVSTYQQCVTLACTENQALQCSTEELFDICRNDLATLAACLSLAPRTPPPPPGAVVAIPTSASPAMPRQP